MFAAGVGIGLFIGGGAPTGRAGAGAAAGAELVPGKTAPSGILSIGTFTYWLPMHHENGIRTLRRHGRRLGRRLLCRVLSRARDDECAKVGGVRLLHLEVFLIVLLIIFLDVVMQRRAVHGADAAGFRRRRALWLGTVFALAVGDAPDRVEAVESRLVHPCRRAIVLLLHFADRHLALAFHRRIGVDRRELVRDVTDQQVILLVVDPVELSGLIRRRGQHHAVEQRHHQVAMILGEAEVAAVGVDRSAPARVAHVIDRHVAHAPGTVLGDVAGPQIQLTFFDRIDDLRLERERRLRAKNRHLQRGQLVVGLRQKLVVEPQHEGREEHRRGQRWFHQRPGRYAAGLQRGDFVFRRKPRERVKDGDEDRHRQRHRDSEGNRQQEKLSDHLPGEPASHKIPELSGDVLQQQERRERRQREHERPDVLLQDVLADYFHSRIRRSYERGTSSIPQGCTAVPGLYIPLSTRSIQGSRGAIEREHPPGF